MQEYTRVLQKPLDSISWDDDNFVEELLQVAQLFRPFSAAMDEFISEHGYAGDPADTDAKVQFIRSAFEREQMVPPREIREWFTQNQPVRRETVFQICFAFHLDSAETDEFFRRYYARERSFNCHQVLEAIYYFCLLNGLSYARAQEIYEQVPKAGKGGAGRTSSGSEGSYVPLCQRIRGSQGYLPYAAQGGDDRHRGPQRRRQIHAVQARLRI